MGAGTNNSSGVAVFSNGNVVYIQSQGHFAGGPNLFLNSTGYGGYYPSYNQEYIKPFVLGADAGVGLSAAVSNASCPSDLEGDSMSVSLTLPIIGIQGSTGIWTAGFSIGLGGGIAFSSYPTRTLPVRKLF